MRKKRISYHLFVPLWCVFLFSGCSQTEEQQKRNSLKVEAEQVSAFNQKISKTYIGTVEESESTALSFSISGTIQSIEIKEGSRVFDNEPLAFLNQTSACNTLKTAKANLEQAKDAYNRMSILYKNASIPEIKMIEIETKLHQAQATYNIAQKNYEDCILKAPFSGIIGKKLLSAGENTLPGQTVCTLLNINEVKIKIAVPEMEVAEISGSEEIEILVPALGDTIFKGNKIEKGIKANPVTHTYDMHIKVENPTHHLLPGMVCKVHLLKQEKQVAITVPIRAIQAGKNEKNFVWVVKEGTASRVYVKTGEIINNRIVILEGIKEGDFVIIDGYQKVSEGTKIEL